MSEPKDDYIRVIESFIHYVEEADESFYCDETVQEFVKKLKAWKRLKGLGFRFIGETCEYKPNKHFGSVFFETSGDISDIYEDAVEFYDDLDLLFEGEER